MRQHTTGLTAPGTNTLRLEWTEYDGIWYVSRADRNVLPSNDIRFTFVVESFNPNVEVSDEQFALDGLALPEGLLVIDSIAGISYRYTSTPPLDEEALGTPLEDAQFVRKIIKTRADSPSPLVDSNQGLPPLNGDRRTGAVGEVSIVAQTSVNPVWMRWAGLACVMVAAGGIGLFVYRHKSRG